MINYTPVSEELLHFQETEFFTAFHLPEDSKLRKSSISGYKAIYDTLEQGLEEVYVAFGKGLQYETVIATFEEAVTFLRSKDPATFPKIVLLDYITVGESGALIFTCKEFPSLQAHLKDVNPAFDVAALKHVPDIEKPGIYCTDMDMTAIKTEVIDKIAGLAGAGERVAQITHDAMAGKIDFYGSLVERVECLKGLPVEKLETLKPLLIPMEGLDHILPYLQKHNWITCLISGGFTYFSEYFAKFVGFTYFYSNILDVEDGKLNGKLGGPIVGPIEKGTFAEQKRKEHNIPLEQSIGIGDGANDLDMIKKSGCGMSYHAKPVVAAQASIGLEKNDLSGIVTLLEARRFYKHKLSIKEERDLKIAESAEKK